MGAARLAWHLSRAEADLVPAAAPGARLRRQAARERTPGIRRLALARILDSARCGDRIPARRLPAGAGGTAPVSGLGSPPRPTARGVCPGLKLNFAARKYSLQVTGGAMKRNFLSLPSHSLGDNAGFRRPSQQKVGMESPALTVMTDLTRVSPATIGPETPIEAAHRFMMMRGVRLLLVVDERESVLGVISATDILGERPMRVATSRALRRDELVVADVMTPAERVEVIALADVDGARVGHVVATLMHAGRQHALVVDSEPEGRPMVRGILSLSQVARQLGEPLQLSEVARTFAEIEAVLSH